MRACLDQGNGKYGKKDPGSRETQAVRQNLVLGPEHNCEGGGKVGSQAVVCPIACGAPGGDGTPAKQQTWGGS